MPLPTWLRSVNRVVTNRVLGVLSGRLRPFARLAHTGRRTGHTYSTTLWAFERGGMVAIALTYGEDVDWAKNVLAGGHASIYLGGTRSRLVAPRLVGDEKGRPFMPPPVRAALSLLGVHSYLLAERA